MTSSVHIVGAEGNTVQPKDPDTNASYEIDFFHTFVSEARRSYEYDIGHVVRAQRDTGLYYVCTAAGRTGSQYPVWPRAAGESVRDGSVTWLATHPDNAAAPAIDSATWIVPTGLTLVSQQETDHTAIATFSGGTAGEDYEVTARVTPTAGQARDVTIIIPVREL